MFGEIFGSVFGVVNAPIRAAEDLMSGGETFEENRIFSKPIDALADALEDVDKKE